MKHILNKGLLYSDPEHGAQHSVSVYTEINKEEITQSWNKFLHQFPGGKLAQAQPLM